jgi:hypothetical protein
VRVFRTQSLFRAFVLRFHDMPKPPKPIAPEGGLMPPHAPKGEWLELYPLVASYLCDSTWEGEAGKSRRPSSLMVFPQHGQWTFLLKEPNHGLELRAVVEAPEQGVPALEGMLASPQPPWTTDPYARARKGKKS